MPATIQSDSERADEIYRSLELAPAGPTVSDRDKKKQVEVV